MGEAVRTRERVEEHLAAIRERYDRVTVNQTTVSVDGDRFRAARERFEAGPVDAYVAVSDHEDRVLHVEGSENLVLPGTATGTGTETATDTGESLEDGALAAVESATGLACAIDGVREATIAGIHNADDPAGETLYRLVVVFEARPVDEPAAAEGEWAEALEWTTEAEAAEHGVLVAPPES